MRRAAIDVGGTFTDCLILNERGEISQFKVPTTPQDSSLGVVASLQKAAKAFGEPFEGFLGSIDTVIHGTTLASNTLLTQRGAKTGMITTKNFRDIIEIRRGFKNIRTSMYNVFVPPYKPLVPRYLRLGVDERTLWNGEIATPLNEGEVREAVAKLKGQGVESIAVCYLHSYANPENERRTVEICKEAFDGGYVAASHEIIPIWREYERFSTTVVSAYVGPTVARYLPSLTQRLENSGFKGTLLMVLASGSVQTVEHCIPRAVYLISSGPAAGPLAALWVGESMGQNNLISVDMGGTSFDICLIHQGEIPTSAESWVEDERVAIKMVDIHTVGAGGGSIAWIDSLGLLRVGPQSAGAEPGPTCYGKGGELPTVTDADLVLGYLPADYFLGGEIPLNAALAQEAIKKVGDRLGMSVPQAAQAIFTTVNSFMADQITERSTKRGHDVRDFTLVVGGGAGPVHGAFIADLLGIRTVVVPPLAALYSASGMLNMQIGQDYARSYVSRAESIDLERVNGLYQEMEKEALDAFGSMHIPPHGVTFSRTADMRYIGQFHEVEAEVGGGGLSAKDLNAAAEAFHRKHEQLYTFNMPWKGVEFLTFRLKARAAKESVAMARIPSGGPDPSPAWKRQRTALFQGRELEVPVYDGDKLMAGNVISGPAIIEKKVTTVVVPESFKCTVDAFGNYILRKAGP